MNKIYELIKKLCPNGVEYKPLWSLTAWDKRFNGIEKEKQKKGKLYRSLGLFGGAAVAIIII